MSVQGSDNRDRRQRRQPGHGSMELPFRRVYAAPVTVISANGFRNRSRNWSPVALSQSELQVSRSDGATLLIRLSGSWTLAASRPSADLIEREITIAIRDSSN
jgi:hypothetical protein